MVASDAYQARTGCEAGGLAVVQLPALRNRRCGRSGDRVAVDGSATWQPVAGRGTLEERRTLVLPHPSSKRRRLDGAPSIKGEPGVKGLTELPQPGDLA
jgi:hypothetical protein